MDALSVIGLSHRTAPVEVRERFALPPQTALDVLRRIHRERVLEEALILDTCNRTEVYFVARRTEDPLGYLLGHVARAKGTAAAGDTSVLYRQNGRAAVEHLFLVAASLDSQIVGEHQILGQVKAAYRIAVEARTAKFLLNKLLHRAFRVGKRVFSETDIGRGSVGVAQAAVDLARQKLGDMAGTTILLVGAGRNAEAAAAALAREGAARLVVANRTPGRARELGERILERRRGKGKAIECPALLRQGRGPAPAEAPPAPETEAIGLEAIGSRIAEADLVIASTGSEQPVLTAERVRPALEGLNHRLCIVDLAVPRDVDPSLGRLANVELLNLDDLDALVAENLARRQADVPKAETIVAEEVESFARWIGSLQVAPTIGLLQKRFEQHRQALIDQHAAGFDQSDAAQLEQFARTLCGRLLHDPMTFLRGLSEEAPVSETLATVDAVRRMFNLDDLTEG